MARGKLRLYLGAAPGVGKTYAMLNEGWRRKERGTDVVIGWVQDHGRPHTDAQIRDLEIFPRRTVEYRGQTLEEMDLDGLLARQPELVLVDELAHTNAPGSKHAKRWQDVEELLDAGINVISTINLQHLESLNDVVEGITGVAQHETVPDPVVRAADQLELVDMAPEALRRRLAHGNVYPPERIDAALANYFRTGNLTALRELALLWVADRVDEELNDYRERHNIAGPWETKERVVVSLTGSPGSAVLIRRAARMAMRTKAELVGVHVRTDDSLTGPGSQGLVSNRALLDDLGGRYVEVVGAEVAPALVQVARAENATQLVMGATHRSRLNEYVRGSVINSVIRAAGGSLDVHVIATDGACMTASADGDADESERPDGDASVEPQPSTRAGRHRPSLLSPLSVRRRVAALVIGVIGFPLLTLILTAGRSGDSLATALSSYLVLVVVVAATGGVWPAALAAVAGFLLSNYYFAPPIHTFTIADTRDILALVMFLVTAGVVSVLVDLSARRTATAIQARTDAQMLARVAGRMVAPEGNPLPALLDELLVAFRLESVAVLRAAPDHDAADPTSGADPAPADGWSTVLGAGDRPPRAPDEATLVLPLTEIELLALRGPGLTAEDREILAAFAAQLATALESDRLHAEAAEADSLARANQLRSRPPGRGEPRPAHPAGLDQGGVVEPALRPARVRSRGDPNPPADHRRRGRPAEQPGGEPAGHEPSPDRLDGRPPPEHRRRRAGRRRRSTAWGRGATPIAVDIEHPLPRIRTDPVLLERALANLIDNALIHAGENGIRIEAGPVAGRVDIRVIDRGPGIRPADRDRVFRPFQRLGDSQNRGGVGLGLAVARGFVEAVGGELDVEDTPGGGCTMVVRIPETDPIEADHPGADPVGDDPGIDPLDPQPVPHGPAGPDQSHPPEAPASAASGGPVP